VTSLEVGFDGENEAGKGGVEVRAHHRGHRAGVVDGGEECQAGRGNDELFVAVRIESLGSEGKGESASGSKIATAGRPDEQHTSITQPSNMVPMGSIAGLTLSGSNLAAASGENDVET
jgi:hypothetical protein